MKFTLAIAAFMVTAATALPGKPTSNHVEHVEREVFGRENRINCNSYTCDPDANGSPYSSDCAVLGCPGSCFANIQNGGRKRCSNTS